MIFYYYHMFKCKCGIEISITDLEKHVQEMHFVKGVDRHDVITMKKDTRFE